MKVLKINFYIISFLAILLLFFNDYKVSRFVILATFVLMNILELSFTLLYFAFKNVGTIRDDMSQITGEKEIIKREFISHDGEVIPEEDVIIENENLVTSEFFISEFGIKVYNFVLKHIDFHSHRNGFFSTTTEFNIQKLKDDFYQNIINLNKINDIRRINKFFEIVNSKLPLGGIYIGKVETNSQERKRIIEEYGTLGYLSYFFRFIYKRMMPKIRLTQKFYFFLSEGRDRALSKAEALGRLASCGFDILDYEEIDNYLFFAVKKAREPYFDLSPSYGLLFKMNRIGKEGKIFGVYKMRTMHPYSEYLQEFIYKKNQLSEGGKFKDDFRITTWGKFCRATWIDELPMLVNVFILRNIKIVGVRPLSQHYFSLYSQEIQTRRIKTKPGLIPPYYAQYPTPKTLEEVQENELKYLEEYEKHPFLTDVKYFTRAMFNIIFRKARSK